MTLVSKNIYIDKLDHIVNKYNSRYHSTIKIEPVDLKSNIYWLIKSKEINDKIQNLKLVKPLGHQNIKMFLQKVTFQIGLKKVLWLKKLEMLWRGHIC